MNCSLLKPKVKIFLQSEELCRKLFFENLKVEYILKETGLSYVQYKKAVKGLEEVRREYNIDYVGKSKAEGKTNSIIAEELNVNRCTVTVYWKEYKQKYADTVLNT